MCSSCGSDPVSPFSFPLTASFLLFSLSLFLPLTSGAVWLFILGLVHLRGCMCGCVCTWVSVYLCFYVCLYVCVFANVCMCVYVYLFFVCVCACLWMCPSVCALCVCVCVCVCSLFVCVCARVCCHAVVRSRCLPAWLMRPRCPRRGARQHSPGRGSYSALPLSSPSSLPLHFPHLQSTLRATNGGKMIVTPSSCHVNLLAKCGEV